MHHVRYNKRIGGDADADDSRRNYKTAGAKWIPIRQFEWFAP